MAQGKGFGKAILFGEHFVVEGNHGIVSALDLATIAEVGRISGSEIKVNDRREGSKGYSESKLAQQKESMERTMNFLGLDAKENAVEITLSGNLPGFSGIGASAASCVAIVRALNGEFGLQLSDEKINAAAFEAEKAYQGKPSGIDNTAATYGGLLWYKKGDPPAIERMRIREPVEIVMGNTGLVADTAKVVLDVVERKKANPEKYNPIYENAEKLASEARKALEEFDLGKVGKLMDENHKLLQEIDVSCRELNDLVETAKKHGALGAKLTGGGRGGCMIALTPGKELQERVAKAMEGAGFAVLRTKIGV